MIDRLEDLRLFVAIVERGSLTAAAKSQALTPGAVSLRLTALEKGLETHLLRRTTRRLQLTEPGERFLETARRVLADVDDLQQEFAHEHGSLKGLVRVTAPWDMGRNYVAPALDRFMADHPDVTTSLMLSDAPLDLNEAGIDIGIRHGRLPDSPLQLRRISTNRRIPVAAPRYLDRVGRPTSPADLLRMNCMAFLRNGRRSDNWPFLSDGTVTTQKVFGDRDANDGDLLRLWAIDGKGVILKSAWDVVEDFEKKLLEPMLVELCPSEVDLQIVMPAMRHRPRRVTALADHLAAMLRGLDKRLEHLGLKPSRPAS